MCFNRCVSIAKNVVLVSVVIWLDLVGRRTWYLRAFVAVC